MLLLFAASLPSLVGAGAAPTDCVAASTPKVNMRANVARATSSPWVDSNAARYIRTPDAKYCVEAPGRSAALAAAEAFAFGVSAWIKSADGAVDFGKMLDFIKALPAVPELPAIVNLGVVDDNSAGLNELLNLLSRRNLLFRIVKSPDPKLLTVAGPHAADPSKEAYEIRQKLGDDKRVIRVYGTEVVVTHLTGDGKRARLHLLNYGNRSVNGVRIRVLGNYPKGELHLYGTPDAKLLDYSATSEATEFTVPTMNEYAVVDLGR